jgi:hypothetical protein
MMTSVGSRFDPGPLWPTPAEPASAADRELQDLTLGLRLVTVRRAGRRCRGVWQRS